MSGRGMVGGWRHSEYGIPRRVRYHVILFGVLGNVGFGWDGMDGMGGEDRSQMNKNRDQIETYMPLSKWRKSIMKHNYLGTLCRRRHCDAETR